MSEFERMLGLNRCWVLEEAVTIVGGERPPNFLPRIHDLLYGRGPLGGGYDGVLRKAWGSFKYVD